MKTRRLHVIMILVLVFAAASAFAAASVAEQAAKYAAEQEGKHMFLAQTREDMAALRSCLMPLYRPAVRPEASPDVSSIMPSAKMIPSIVQPDSTAIAASPRPEIITTPEDKK